jgi:hypothetical protein
MVETNLTRVMECVVGAGTILFVMYILYHLLRYTILST